MSAPVYFIDSVITNRTIPIINYWWDLGNGIIATTKTPNTIYNIAGDKTIMLIGQAANGCATDTVRKIITIPFKPLAKFGYALPLCDNKTILFSDSSTVVPGTINKWSWLFDDGTTSSFKNSTAKLSAGIHTVNLVVTSNQGCNSDTSAINIIVNAKPVVDFNANNSCKNIMVSFIADNKTLINITKWHWDLDRGIMADIQNTQYTFTINGNYNIQLFGVSDAGCSSDTVKKNVVIYGTQAFAGNDTVATPNQPIQLQASGGVNYEWSPPFGLNSTTIYNPIATNDKDRIYVLKAITQFGCVSFDTLSIKVYNGPEIYVPRSFTPNGDGLNEIVKALPVGVKQFLKFSIFNRLGQVIFTTNSFFKGWNGIYNGQVQNAGAYMWIATGIDFNGKKLFRSGTIMLVR